MDAVTYIRELGRMCQHYTDAKRCDISCPFDFFCQNTRDEDAKSADEMVATVEQWSKEHPLVTNGEAAVGMMEKMDAPYIRCRKNEVGQVEMILDASWWDAEYKGE